MTVECTEESSDFEWTPYFEVHLIHSMGGLKLLGINQRFFTAIVLERFFSAVGMNVPADSVLKKLQSYYDFAEGSKMQPELPFPNDFVEFSLPPEDFPNLGKRDLDDRFSTDENSLGSKSESSSSVSSSDVSIKKEMKVLTSKLSKKEVVKKSIPSSQDRKSLSSSSHSIDNNNKKKSIGGGGAAAAATSPLSSALSPPNDSSTVKGKEELKKWGKKRPGGERKSEPPSKRARHSNAF